MNSGFYLHESLVFFLLTVFALAFILGIFLGKPVIRWLKKRNHYDQVQKEYCEKLEVLHQDKKYTPTAGGILFFIVLLLTIFFWLPLGKLSTWLFAFLIISWSSLGWYDDIVKKRKKKGHGISAKQKFVLQLLISAVITTAVMYIYKGTSLFYTLRVPFFGSVSLGHSVLGQVFYFILAVLAIVGTGNAVNLTDGLDGLAAGTTCMCAFGLLVVAVTSTTIPLATDIPVLLTALLGVSLAFLKYNCSPAQVFMGDTGSLLIGGVLGSCAVMLRAELLLILLGGVFVAEAGSVILQIASCRFRKKRIFLCSPLHHHYEYKGVSETQVVKRFWTAGFFCMVFGIIAALWR
ncbi:phospho-N-acetylmuramoyl-pentapeptide-transferase [Chlamydia abortus]|uniref:Phospho-N-acetylmuramoyl-pentapeptide-transferase n=1 Tax=Chlamydia abortus (strain DSM 27085 / S26/3) TaxID=218497 RepID=MRAY_CHLAB|nr:phospho-N-acetylmuramoyl-pentapeptide-transferase [Chlamydia abortus]Q5L520.1 RecName: Full=Phospho-N-acetylmuramoyl-pentapeptide-transferase; AltName: Full=UDP-MurNAc-pentapeptide phosphotransferase [Chlamydia abortus S26/3]ASD30939.1 phospho-N-acetylmuramoyl-pentapeptide-transferase [Chlamydia abortus]AUS60315.1 phospho-N-acetylmuramoyl-pentapeptide-transferase [Chlamydia abortus]QRR31585.1 phospho-N-acetylmuramoyl-pentapeptide-transferase [Chlamydia abortus]CAH64275.1 putative phospho-N-